MKQEYDALTTRCPMLGHLVPFHYCMKDVGTLPCRKVIDCWHEYLDIRAYLAQRYTEEEISSIVSPPKPKVLQILELVKKARDRTG